MQYKLKKGGGGWRDYKSKSKLKRPTSYYLFRLMNKKKTKVLLGENDYDTVLKRLRQIEYFK